MTVITRYDAAFTALNTIFTLTLPKPELEVALRVYREQARVSVYTLVDPAIIAPQTYNRHFMLVAENQDVTDLPLAAKFFKYIATIPFGTPEAEVHIIEVIPAPEVTSFEVEQVG